ncbi:MAG: TauD/TfdA family dioxygenase [Microcystis sp. M49637_WE12]|nr:TauD/TfdA family dioxygenase [Microcystis sp. M49637_WE12]
MYLLKTSNHRWLDKPNEIAQETVNKNLDFFLPFREKLLLEPGIVIFRLDSALTETEMRLIYAFISRIFGLLNHRYGYFFDVIDRGMDYTKEAIPVSMTNAETGYHTDSTAKNYFPDLVGLLCLAAADEGGDSLVVNAANLYQYFWQHHTDLVPYLYEPLARDVITPGEINSQEAIQKNNFPLFSTDSRGLVFRYMRYWIEVAYSKLEIAQPEAITKTLDIIDDFFSKPENIVRFKMKKGDIFYINNRFLCHNRTAFKNSGKPRQMVRSWINL